MSQQDGRIAQIKRLKIVFLLTGAFLIAEIIGGLLTRSLALIADAGHMFADAVGLALVLFAMIYARRPPTPEKTFGFYRMEILASLANGVVLCVWAIYVLYEAYQRIVLPQHVVNSVGMMIVAIVGLGVNLTGLKLLGGAHSHHHDGKGASGYIAKESDMEHIPNLGVESARLEVLSDTFGSVGVIAAAAIILFTGFTIIDSVVSIGLAVFIIARTWSLMKKAVSILMQSVPTHIRYEEVKNAILSINGVAGIFDLHIWTITTGMYALSAHVVVLELEKSQSILKMITSTLEKKFGIAHATIQIETYHPDS